MIEAALVRDEAALADLAGEWDALLRRCPAATPFQSPAWLLPWWRAFHPGELRTVGLRRGGDLVGLAPLYLEDGAHGRRLLPLGIGVSDHMDVLMDPAHAVEAGYALAESLAAQTDWSRCEFEELDPDAMALHLPALPGAREERVAQSACAVIALNQGLPPGQARKLRMSRHRLARREGVALEPATDLSAFLEALFRLHGARWRERGEDGVLAEALVRGFHESAAPALARAGLLRGWTLTIEGRVAGAYYGLALQGRAYAYLGGFDPAFSFESPGTLLLGHALEEARREGCAEFSLLRGQEAYKYAWGARDRWNLRRSFVRDAAS